MVSAGCLHVSNMRWEMLLNGIHPVLELHPSLYTFRVSRYNSYYYISQLVCQQGAFWRETLTWFIVKTDLHSPTAQTYKINMTRVGVCVDDCWLKQPHLTNQSDTGQPTSMTSCQIRITALSILLSILKIKKKAALMSTEFNSDSGYRK